MLALLFFLFPVEKAEASSSYQITNYNTNYQNALDLHFNNKAQTDKNYDVYIRSDSLRVSGSTGEVTGTGRWNVRGGPGTNFWVVGQVNAGSKLTVLGSEKAKDGTNFTWYKIQFNQNWVNASKADIDQVLNPNNVSPTHNHFYQFLDLSSSVGLNAKALNDSVLAGRGILAGKGQAFIDASKQHSVNEIYLISHALLETGNGNSQLARGMEVGLDSNGKPQLATSSNRSSLKDIKMVYNMFGYGAFDSCAKSCGAEYAYSQGWFSPEQAIIGGAWLVGNNYVNNGQETLYKMRWNPANPNGRKYATDIGWAVKQTSRMANLYNQLSSSSKSYDIPRYQSQPGTAPDYSVIAEGNLTTYPTGVIGETTANVNFRSSPNTSGNTLIRTLNSGTKVEVHGVNQNDWYRVKVGNQEGWLSAEYVNVKNLFQVKTSGANLNVRNSAGGAVVGNVSNNQLIVARVNNSDNPVTSGTWMQIRHGNGSAWVSRDFVSQLGSKAMPSDPSHVTRLNGLTRYDTSAMLSQQGWNSSDVVILARGDRFSDALAGVPLAKKHDAPLLISRSERLDNATKKELERLKAKKVIILGGPIAISEPVENSIKSMGIQTERIAGLTLNDTAALIAKEVSPNGSNKAIIVSNERFHDALSIASYAGKNQVPILLANTQGIPKATRDALNSLNVNETLVLGGPLVISNQAVNTLPNVTRLDGLTRFDTNVMALEYSKPSQDNLYVVTSNDFPDGLSAAALAAKQNAGVIIVDNGVHNRTSSYINGINPKSVTILGGDLAINNNTYNQLINLFR
ncbi:cell wall-binding repeat-containing protein [Alkalihalobacillus pseudalcaliphilus]|uniref:cell wall-binding repeat-containing protein n=1 Tax=Alkalihalobacillus pseudalcaliphilus TaxID=79884 RepID=UPI00235F9DB3|nr:cell wall-binding repeat-containing protein [Alkalihalobacillus pseudalcaliphilus]